MAGDNAKSSSNNIRPPPPPSSSARKSRWESSSSSVRKSRWESSSSAAPTTTIKPPLGTGDPKNKPSTTDLTTRNSSDPKPNLNPIPSLLPNSNSPYSESPISSQNYGFHMLHSRTIHLADGTIRSYFALPPDYKDFPPLPMDRVGMMGSDGFRNRDAPFGPNFISLKRKFGYGENRGVDGDEFARRKQKLLQYGNASANLGSGTCVGAGVDPSVMKAFLYFVKLVIENPDKRKNYLENGKHGPLKCLACGRDYQLLPAEEVAANQDDLIMWPPMVIIHNTNTGKGPDGRMQGLGNKDMNRKIRDLGFSGAKAKSLYAKDGHLGITLMMFAGDQRGLKNAMRLADHFKNESHGRTDWVNVQSTAAGKDEESDPNLVLVDQKLGGRRRILYGYLATAFDLDEVDVDTRKKVTIESKCEKLQV
ncbi:uncharacterized protein LOC130825637 isoform X2 [Amaranthus tricolor]|uniref:uncharacterized protein LOC130825637 isoform X2 n=1 Tax=Amaranthus tricolor TaxID=29722 RepID=UPI00258A7A16|nr:uncharacterized protein LOC130825637 isoform X2 [Amaranthus tricolor]